MNILIYGASSTIAEKIARIYATEKKANFFLVGRNTKKLLLIARDLEIRGANHVEIFANDLNLINDHKKIFQAAKKNLNHIDLLLVAHGYLGDHKLAEKDFSEAQKIFLTNFIGPASILSMAAIFFEKQGKGTIALLSSVAGDRGRGSNYFYGSSKAAITTFLSGLRNRLFSHGVTVVTIKLGFVSSSMTEHCKKNLFWIDSNLAAKKIVYAIENKKENCYIPWFWYWIMTIIVLLPERVFKRISF